VKGGGNLSHVRVHIACQLLVLVGGGHLHFAHTFVKRTECTYMFAKWPLGFRYNKDFVLLNENWDLGTTKTSSC
jgi:hypothetical protein